LCIDGRQAVAERNFRPRVALSTFTRAVGV
jgi:hypothetical protein